MQKPGDAEHSICVALEFPKQITVLRVPEADRAIVVTRSQSLSVGRPCDAVNPATLHVGSSPKKIAGMSVPDADGTVHRSGIASKYSTTVPNVVPLPTEGKSISGCYQRKTRVKFQQRYQKSHRIFRERLYSKNFRQLCGSLNCLLSILGAYSTRTSPSIPPI
jgi:hypothetical protein